ncbi:MAG: T9SS type A sorting domain-containing protein [bacterium]|nr:T9SS type A sorting domain-containing protein [bacterium]
MNSRLRYFTLLLILTLFSVSMVFAAGSPVAVQKEAEAARIVQKMMRSEPVTAEEKAFGTPYLEQQLREQSRTNPPSIDLVGGPDAFGYRFVDSQEPNGPVFNWIPGGGTNITGLTDDNSMGPFPIGFDFSFYGNTYTQFYACSNGMIQFGGAYNYSYSTTLPHVSDSAGVWMWGRDMHCGYGGTTVTYQNLTAPNRLVVTYDSLAQYSTATNRVSLQVILYQSGEVLVQYGTITGTPTIVTAGIQNYHGSIFLAYTTSGVPVPLANSAILYYTLGQASNPVPASMATGVPLNATLSWTPAPAATSYNVLLDTVNPPVTVVATGITTTSYTPTNLVANTTYYWQVIASNGTSTNPGPIWSFTTGTGAAPIAPSAATIQTSTMNSLTIGWTDNANDETGFPIYRSLDNVNFTLLGTAPANAVSYTDGNLELNTRYYYRIFATGGGGTSTAYAFADGWTLANVPGTPTIAATGITSGQINLFNSTPANPNYTQYSIYCSTNQQYVQANGAFGTTAVWRTLTQWGTPVSIIGLTAGQSYVLNVTAQNGANVATAASPSVTLTTSNAFSLPFNENFTTATPTAFPPADWIIAQQPVIGNTWVYFATGNGNTGSARINFWSDSNRGSMDFLWTPPISTLGVSSALVTFDWSYYGGYTASYNDTLELVYSTDGGVTYVPAMMWWARGTGPNNLTTGTTGGATTPGTTWGHAEITLPEGAGNQASIRVGFLGHTDYGPDVFLDNISISANNQPRIGFTRTTIPMGNVAVGYPRSDSLYVKSVGVGPLMVSAVTGPAGCTFNWTTRTIPQNDSAALVVTWLPTAVGSLNDIVTVTSNAANGPTNTFGITGNAIPGMLAGNELTPESMMAPGTFTFTVRYSSLSVTPDSVLVVMGTNRVQMTADSGAIPGTQRYTVTTAIPTVGTYTHYYTAISGASNVRLPEGTGTFAGPRVLPAQFGGPDGGGYFYRTSNHTNGPVYSWVDISTTGTPLTLTGDDATTPLSLGTFVFPYYGNTYSNCIVSTNGNIQFAATGSTNYSNGALPTTNLPAATLMYFWDDLQLDQTTHWVKYQDMNDGRFIISYYLRDRNFSNPPGYRNFNVQVILYSTGRIVYQYGAADAGNPAYATGTIGIQGAQTGNMFLQYGTNTEAMPAEGFAIEFTTDLGSHGYATGYVTRATGAPIEGAHVRFVPAFNATTDATGYWFLELPSGTYPVQINADCFGSVVNYPAITIVENDTTEMRDTLYRANVATNVTSLEFQVPPSESRSQTIILTNSGDYQLEFATRVQYSVADELRSVASDNVKLWQRSSEAPAMRFGPPSVVVNEPIKTEAKTTMAQPLNGTPEQKAAYQRWLDENTTNTPPAIDQTWGPDGYGYEAMDNVEAGFPTWLSYMDIRGIGTEVITNMDDQILVTTLDNFSFRYYGTNYTSAVFSSNGYIQFDATGANWLSGTLPNANVVNGVFQYWRDLVTSVTKYYDATTNRFIIQWDGRHFGGTDSVHFQMQLFGANNAIVFFYNTIPAAGTATVGIQNADGTNNRNIACYNTAAPTNGWVNYAVSFTDMSPGGGGGWQRWAMVDPANGIVVPGGTAELFLQVTMPDSAVLGQVYSASVLITTNACSTVAIPFTTTVVSAPEEVTGLPHEYKLHQNFPNPFNPTTEIRFDLKNSGITKLTVYNMLGQEVGTMVNGYLPAGYHTVRFEAKSLAAGVYFYRIESGNFTSLKKMILVK